VVNATVSTATKRGAILVIVIYIQLAVASILCVWLQILRPQNKLDKGNDLLSSQDRWCAYHAVVSVLPT
jgi:hypothetical protein